MHDEITATVGSDLYSFDGRILEIFGGEYPRRFHVRHMHLSVTGPDRKGRRTVMIAHGQPEAPGGSLTWHPTAKEWEQSPDLAALLETVRSAVAAISGPGVV
ncbi:hypothetical protein ACIRQY_24875 [Streptomyces sp. NPDC101490]|uniref:hypothetical protein n=1 Tax=Streptomyces sp. NPDC101490 TaxID=3366143 RepID=UPI00383090B7